MRPFEIIQKRPVQIPPDRNAFLHRPMNLGKVRMDEGPPDFILFRANPVFGHQNRKMEPVHFTKGLINSLGVYFPSEDVAGTGGGVVLETADVPKDLGRRQSPKMDKIAGVIIKPYKIEGAFKFGMFFKKKDRGKKASPS